MSFAMGIFSSSNSTFENRSSGTGWPLLREEAALRQRLRTMPERNPGYGLVGGRSAFHRLLFGIEGGARLFKVRVLQFELLLLGLQSLVGGVQLLGFLQENLVFLYD